MASFVLFVGCGGSRTTAEEPATESGPAVERPDLQTLRETPEGFQKAEVLHVITSPEGYAVLLANAAGDRVVPIFVGETIAMSIHLRLERRRYERPLTHDLLDKMLEELGANVVKVHIDGLKTGVFVGTVFLATDSEVLEFDARSSDAIAVALGNEVPIFIADSVVEAAGISREELEQPVAPDDEMAPPPTDML